MNDAPKKTHLKDYQSNPYRIESTHLSFDVYDDATVVSSKLELVANSAPPPTLELNGSDLELVSITVNGDTLDSNSYTLSSNGLILLKTHPKMTIAITNRIYPQKNTELEGLYLTESMLCTQCEPQGFRRITYFIDRPDILSCYTVKISAAKDKYPTLLSNGNLVERGDGQTGRHWAIYEDPFPKPSYLFALVAGNLASISENFTTHSGRKVSLEIYTSKDEIDRCEHAMDSLVKALKWDEKAYNLECDLSDYKIVVANDFNFGAMENKGLNIFNSAYVLAKKEMTTDCEFQSITEVVGHEYFHNWTGNRVTCRDWFQLCLKEGLTVFREQEFAATLVSKSVSRIAQIARLKKHQFPEDDGPTRHPPRPDSFVEINNFYTATIYEKGAEIVRMLKLLIGKAAFQKGMSLYFERHDGQAATQEDFVSAMADASGVDFTQFFRWYTQAGAPEIHIDGKYEATDNRYTLSIQQKVPSTTDGKEQKPFHIPIEVGLIGSDGKEFALNSSGETSAVLELKCNSQNFHFENITTSPVPSLFRGMSAPVRLELSQSQEQLKFLLRHDSDPVNVWESGQSLFAMLLREKYKNGTPADEWDDGFCEVFSLALNRSTDDLAYKATLCALPSYEAVISPLSDIDPDRLVAVRNGLKRAIAKMFRQELIDHYRRLHAQTENKIDSANIGRRQLKNVCLDILSYSEDKDIFTLAADQFYDNNSTMTDVYAALGILVHHNSELASDALQHYYDKWLENPLCLDRWFRVQATSPHSCAATIKELCSNPKFSAQNPNRLRSLIFTFCRENPCGFHAANGQGYAFCREFVIDLGTFNRQIAAGLMRSFSCWKLYTKKRSELMRKEIAVILDYKGLPSEVRELANQIYES